METAIRKIDGRWYAFEVDRNNGQVFSIGNDNPKEGGRWFASLTNSGIQYVASPSTNAYAARSKAIRHGKYIGMI